MTTETTTLATRTCAARISVRTTNRIVAVVNSTRNDARISAAGDSENAPSTTTTNHVMQARNAVRSTTIEICVTTFHPRTGAIAIINTVRNARACVAATS